MASETVNPSEQYFSQQMKDKFLRPRGLLTDVRSRPWWPKEEFPAVEALEENYEAIRGEFERIVMAGRLKFHPQSPGGPRKSVATGAWKIFELYSSGRKNYLNAAEAPITTRIIERFPEIINHPKGLVYFSVVGGGVKIKNHFGPTNSRLRIHLGLNVPPEAKMRVGTEVRPWKNGECFVFDDSWDHEVVNDSDCSRGVLIVDTWHPDVPQSTRRRMMASKRGRPTAKNLQRGGWL